MMRIFKGDYLVLLDDDVILYRDWLKGLIDCAESCEGAGVIGAVLFNKKGEIRHTGADMTTTYPLGQELNEPIAKPVERKCVCSAVMLITRAAAERIGPFDEGFIKYCQDSDYCFRAWEAGFKVMVSPDSKAVHLAGATAALLPNLKELIEIDSNRFLSKWRETSFFQRFEIIDLTRRGVICPFVTRDAKHGVSVDAAKEPHEPRSLEEVKREMDEVRNRYRLEYIDIAGGEPTEYERLPELVTHCRSIGMLPAIITNGRKSGVYAGLIDAGLEDMVILVPGRREERDRMPGREGAFGSISRTIEVIKAKNFGFRTSMTLTDFNYTTLTTVAEELATLRPRMADFVLVNPVEVFGCRKEGGIDRLPRYSDVTPLLAEAAARLSAAGIWTNVRHLPLCMLKGLEQHICNFHQSLFDPYKWDFYQWLKINKREITNVRRRTRRDKPFGTIIEARRKLWFVKHRVCGKNVFFDQCALCANRAICDGVHPRYAAKYGSGEFVASEGEAIRDPLHYRKKDQTWRMMKPLPAAIESP
jgi:MoaA/NifB/PqqE/SkfB family radical SAM enzyme